MAFDKVGIEVSKTREFDNPIGFAIPDGQLGANSILAYSLEPETEYFARAYFDKDGIRTMSKNIGRFWTPALPKALTFNAGNSGGSVSLVKNGTPSDITLFYSTDGSNWTEWNSSNGDLSITLSVGDSVAIKGDNSSFSTGFSDYYRFVVSGISVVDGNVMSLVDSSVQSTEIPSAFCFYNLFYQCNCEFAIDLQATILKDHCYRQMFAYSGITAAPELPATTLASGCYTSMFTNCTSLTQAPALPAEVLVEMCYNGMFMNCTSLTQAPALPAANIPANTYCYNSMFLGCTSLSRVEVYAQQWGNVYSETYNWLYNVSPNGDFYNLGGATIPSGASGIPSGWTEHTSL